MKNYVIGMFVVLVIMALFGIDFGDDEVPRHDMCWSATELYGTAHPDYTNAVCLGEEMFKDDDMRQAQRSFKVASQFRLGSVPNYDPYLRIAEVKCAVGEKAAGIRLLMEYECALDVQVADKSCFETVGGQPRPNSNLSHGCVVWMCSEVFLSSYQNPPEAIQTHVANMRTEVSRVRTTCE